MQLLQGPDLMNGPEFITSSGVPMNGVLEGILSGRELT